MEQLKCVDLTNMETALEAVLTFTVLILIPKAVKWRAARKAAK